MSQERGAWGSRLGFILAAAGSAVGLGNMWKFPYITGENGGGAFVLVYLAFVFTIGLPVMIGEVMIGRLAQSAPVGAYKKLSNSHPGWTSIGALGVITAFAILSFYSVVAGWSLHYIGLSVTDSFAQASAREISQSFTDFTKNGLLNVSYHAVFMVITVVIVFAGVHKGVERAAKVLMPALLGVMLVLFAYATTLKGFGPAVDFVFAFRADKLTGAGVLEALGHSFFTLSVGMGAMLTYGSYLDKNSDIVGTSVLITCLDTFVALLACLVLFPITFTQGLEPTAGPGLVFVNMPIAFHDLPGGSMWSTVFFVLLFFAALTSAVSLLEVAASYFIDQLDWPRKKASVVAGTIVLVLGIPCALSSTEGFFGEGMKNSFGMTFFDMFDKFASNWSLPIGGLGVAAFCAWRMGTKATYAAYVCGDQLPFVAKTYLGWLRLLRYVVPVAILFIIAKALGLVGGGGGH